MKVPSPKFSFSKGTHLVGEDLVEIFRSSGEMREKFPGEISRNGNVDSRGKPRSKNLNKFLTVVMKIVSGCALLGHLRVPLLRAVLYWGKRSDSFRASDAVSVIPVQ